MKTGAQIVLSVLALCAVEQAHATVVPTPGSGDPHFQSVSYVADQVVQLTVATGYALTVEFAADERIDNIAVGDSTQWQVTPNKRGDDLFIRLLGTSAPTTNMTVITNYRTYVFTIAPTSANTPDLPYVVRFSYAAVTSNQTPSTDAQPLVAPADHYKLAGSKALRPASIRDDGLRTYIVFAPTQPMPAIYATDDGNNERLLDGKIRDGQYVIDSINPRLLLRLGRETATATRVLARRKKS